MMLFENVKSKCSRVWGAMKRSHRVEGDGMKTPLNRCLTAFDLTLLGIGKHHTFIVIFLQETWPEQVSTF